MKAFVVRTIQFRNSFDTEGPLVPGLVPSEAAIRLGEECVWVGVCVGVGVGVWCECVSVCGCVGVWVCEERVCVCVCSCVWFICSFCLVYQYLANTVSSDAVQ